MHKRSQEKCKGQPLEKYTQVLERKKTKEMLIFVPKLKVKNLASMEKMSHIVVTSNIGLQGAGAFIKQRMIFQKRGGELVLDVPQNFLFLQRILKLNIVSNENRSRKLLTNTGKNFQQCLSFASFLTNTYCDRRTTVSWAILTRNFYASRYSNSPQVKSSLNNAKIGQSWDSK